MDKYLEILKQYWGYSSFRDLQPEIIQSIGSGKDTLGLMPTGGGKSITFQVPALAMDGICIVITPLIALMKDQVAGLKKRGILATALHSGMTRDEMNVALDNCILGGGKFLYLSPERLTTDNFLIKVKQMKVCMIAVDEAHCISQWGYDFRPSYLNISTIREILPLVPVLALTATATPFVVTDIMEKLHFATQNVFQKSFARKNLSYIVRQTNNKESQLINILQRVPGTSVVYVRNRKQTREYAEMLNRMGISAAYFHAGLTAKDKDKIQSAWMNGTVRVIVCTNAFGMGIDKPDVRTVIHIMAPDSLEAYFQEAGRAGRDGNKAFAVLLWNENNDENKLRKTIVNTFPPTEYIQRVYEAIGNYLEVAVGFGGGTVMNFDIGAFCKVFSMQILAVHNSLKILANAGLLEYQADVEMESRITFIVDNHELYNIQVSHPELDTIIKVLLRSYTGLFTDYVCIDEEKIGKLCALPRQQVYERLTMLQQLRVARYMPQRKSPLITWLSDRIEADKVVLPDSVYAQRQKDLEQRISSVIEYCKNDENCRSVQLLKYFGETSASACGVCDVCIEKKRKAELSNEDFEKIENRVLDLTRANSLIHSELIAKITDYNINKVEFVLRWLADNGIIAIDENGKYTHL